MTNLNDLPSMGRVDQATLDRTLRARMQRCVDFADTYPAPRACHGPGCRQGRDRCPTPDACQISEDSEFGALEGVVRGLPYMAAAWVFIAALAALVWWLA